VKLAKGSGCTIVVSVVVSLHPSVFVMISVAVKDPATPYVCDGFCAVDMLDEPEPGSPKVQFHAATVGLPVD